MEKNVTALSPHPPVLGAYVAVLFLGQIGYCVLLILASKRETKVCTCANLLLTQITSMKHALIKGVGMSLVAANFVMALWAACWVGN